MQLDSVAILHEPCALAVLEPVTRATYHSSRSARDRDRLREEILHRLGWRIVRVWSTDWFANPAQASKRLVESVRRLAEATDR